MFRLFRTERGSFGRARKRVDRAAEQSRIHSLLVASILADPLSELTDPEVRERLRSGERDVTFDELGLDSLARLTLAARLDAEFGYPVTEVDVTAAGTVGRLVALLAVLPYPESVEGGEDSVA